jgi:superfamily II DNA or RNA helicase
MNDAYLDLIANKSRYDYDAGFRCDSQWSHLFPFQADLVRWALRKGRGAMFVDTGLGKTRMQCTFAHEVLQNVGNDNRFLVLAPLAVARQTIAEAASLGIDVRYVRDDASVRPGISIVNYEMLHALDPSQFAGVALDESSIIKNYAGVRRDELIAAFAATPYRLCCTATPAPNEWAELGNHSEFLGIMNYGEMLPTFFTHDASDCEWYLKGWAERAFWEWVCEWATLVRRPSDLGYSDEGYLLPPIDIRQHVIPATADEIRANGTLIAEAAKGLTAQRKVKRDSLDVRVKMAADIANSSTEQFIVWCELNDESKAVTKIVNGAVEVTGSHTPEEKADRLLAFARGDIRALITKDTIAGMGMNFQSCHRLIDVGVSHSYERFYQRIRRCHRFGQKSQVRVDIISSELESDVVRSLLAKQENAAAMADKMSSYTRAFVQANVKSAERTVAKYNPTNRIQWPSWLRSEP